MCVRVCVRACVVVFCGTAFATTFWALLQLLPASNNSNNNEPKNNSTISALKFEPSFEPAALVPPRALLLYFFFIFWGCHLAVPTCSTTLTRLAMLPVHLVNKLAIAFNVSLCASLAARQLDGN